MTKAHHAALARRLSCRALLLGLALMLLASAPALAAANPHSRFAEYQGHKVHYQDYGNGADTVVLIPGWSCDTAFWRRQLPALAPKYRVLLIDLPGHGQSDKPKVEYTQPYFADAVKAVMDHAKVKRAVVAGHSMGANVARLFIRSHPKMALGFISMDGAVDYVPEDPEERAKWIKQAMDFRNQFIGPDGQKRVPAFIKSMHAPQTPPELQQWIEKKMMSTPWPVARSAMLNFVDPKALTNRIMEQPALIICAKSPWLPPDNAVKMKKLFPKLEYHEVGGVGHFLMLEKPAEINAIILRFLQKVMPAGR